ncbi:hypothetical protein OIU77_024135 [Salix suchowensis]|uniref:Uncharacterized protein n=1 Tax=Salix suchowensis TaxID=1278906 RepID=A0ABQ8ZGT6_9ROSI|nr:hypothetical protein OIU77_024135 [Salix suchowensis]
MVRSQLRSLLHSIASWQGLRQLPPHCLQPNHRCLTMS